MHKHETIHEKKAVRIVGELSFEDKSKLARLLFNNLALENIKLGLFFEPINRPDELSQQYNKHTYPAQILNTTLFLYCLSPYLLKEKTISEEIELIKRENPDATVLFVVKQDDLNTNLEAEVLNKLDRLVKQYNTNHWLLTAFENWQTTLVLYKEIKTKLYGEQPSISLQHSPLKKSAQEHFFTQSLLWICHVFDENIPLAFFIPIVGWLYLGARFFFNNNEPLTTRTSFFSPHRSYELHNVTDESQAEHIEVNWNFTS